MTLNKKEIAEFAELVEIRINSDCFGVQDLKRENLLESKMSQIQKDNLDMYFEMVDADNGDTQVTVSGIKRALNKKRLTQ